MLKRISRLLAEKINTKLAAQLMISLLGMFILINTVSSLFIYWGIANITKSNSKRETLNQFKQYEYNINTFCNNIDLISKQLVYDAQIYSLLGYGKLPENERVSLLTTTYNKFNQTLNNFSYIDSIIFYDGNGLVVRTTKDENVVIYDKTKQNGKFFKEQFNNADSVKRLKLVWIGGYTEQEFNIGKEQYNESDEPQHYLSAVRTVFSGNQKGMLVINVRTKYFTSIYNYSDAAKDNEMYIIDSNGKIISHQNENLIGKISNKFEKMSITKKEEAFITNDFDLRKQIVYYRVNNLNWIIVNEVLLNVINKDISYLRTVIIIMFLISLIVASILTKFWIYKITDPLKRLTNTMREIGDGNLGLTLEVSATNEVGVLTNQFNKMSKSIQNLLSQNNLMQDEKRKIEMEVLRSQINPHFIYNTLNVIKWMAIMNRAENVADSISTLSDFLQPIFKTRDVMCNLEEEINYTKNYIKIMNYRFADEFKVEFNIHEELSDCRILKFVLQPLVENSLVHGFTNQSSGRIKILAYTLEDYLFIAVEDSGEGLSESQLLEINKALTENHRFDETTGNQIGLQNVNRRIKLHFGENCGIEMYGLHPNGTGVVLKMPCLKPVQK